MSACDLPPCPPCPPRAPAPCPQVCPPPPPPRPCYPKPVMRGLHYAQTKSVVTKALALSALSGFCTYAFLGYPRREAYRDYYEKGEFEDWAEEMARKGLFQAVPSDTLKDKPQ
ncbi:unnamed protein product [Arctia plantaginis]|uniref:Mitochondrial cytochrome c oxidase subunit VIc/VIIs domain-containing protein n=1 Tax=Arctia plantaginis TaxID=874455 RepID=A0A8S1AVM8_ARCPL|nr:unnamed protein product [Arctia plantaginis]CAB3249089.1 unnamed protein product [Arctia plantaginis]